MKYNTCDFICQVAFTNTYNNVPRLFQVSYDISDNMTREREIKALVKGMRELGLQQATLLTFDEKDSYLSGKLQVNIKPFWKMALTQEAQIR